MSDGDGNIAAEQRRLAAIMFTDMVGYSALSQRDEKRAQELLEEHRPRPKLPAAFAPMLAKRIWPVREISIMDLEIIKALWPNWKLRAGPYLTIHRSPS